MMYVSHLETAGCLLDFESCRVELVTFSDFDEALAYARSCSVGVVVRESDREYTETVDDFIVFGRSGKSDKSRYVNDAALDQTLLLFWPQLSGLGSTAHRLFGPKWKETRMSEVDSLLFAMQDGCMSTLQGWREPVSVRPGARLDSDAMENLDLERLVSLLSSPCRTQFGKKTMREWIRAPLFDASEIRKRLNRISSAIHTFDKTSADVWEGVSKLDDARGCVERIRRSVKSGTVSTLDFVQDLDLLKEFAVRLSSISQHETVGRVVDTLQKIRDMFIRVGVGSLVAPADLSCSAQVKEYSDLTTKLRYWEKLCRMRASINGVTARVIDEGCDCGTHILVSKRKNLTARGINFVPIKGGLRASNEEIDDLCDKLTDLRVQIESISQRFASDCAARLADKVFPDLCACFEDAARLDCEMAHAYLAKNHKWCFPNIDSNVGSMFDLKGMRHPVVELKSTERFVRNDLKIDDETEGVIVYGINSCGKSVLLKTACICVIMAQSGLFVPADSAEIGPFRRIVSQVPCKDDIAGGRSSFVMEMQGLSGMLRLAGPGTLIVADELTRGTEVESSRAVFAAAVKMFQLRGARFLMTTHLRDLRQAMRRCGVDTSSLRECHLAVSVGPPMKFLRTLQDGQGDQGLYGVHIACSVVKDKEFDVFARMALAQSSSSSSSSSLALPASKSRYNAAACVLRCGLCGNRASDTHHIQHQKDASKLGFLRDGTRVNAPSNLIGLCKTCHASVHDGKIILQGYECTSSGTAVAKHDNVGL